MQFQRIKYRRTFAAVDDHAVVMFVLQKFIDLQADIFFGKNLFDNATGGNHLFFDFRKYLRSGFTRIGMQTFVEKKQIPAALFQHTIGFALEPPGNVAVDTTALFADGLLAIDHHHW